MATSLRAPDFLIVGAAKAGTTSLAAYLAEHPDVFMARRKELHFFGRDKEYRRGWEWYCSHFEGAGDARAVGEATPDYMWRERAVERIAQDLPKARIIATLRHPVDRAYSHYWFVRGLGYESRSFEQTLADPEAERRVGYLSRGRYAQQLQRLYDTFGPDQVHVVLFDDLVSDADRTFAELCTWLDVPVVAAAAPREAHNQRLRLRSPRLLRWMVARSAWRRWPRLSKLADAFNRVPVSSEPMAAATRAGLLETFAEDNAALAQLLGRELPGWDS